MRTSDLLRRAKARLTPERWVRHEPRSDDTDCVLTALERSWRPSEWGQTSYARLSAQHLLWQACIGAGDCSRMCLARWNDTPTRTLDEVHAAFDQAIAKAEAAERLVTEGEYPARPGAKDAADVKDPAAQKEATHGNRELFDGADVTAAEPEPELVGA